ncbi:MAG: PEP-CTERM sorting domain-containing protein [Bryobacteraceae bacterium]
MKRTKRNTVVPGLMISLVVLGITARADTITVDFINPSLSGGPGDVLTFSGTMTNNTGTIVFLNGGSVDLAAPFDANTDVSISLLSWPISLNALTTSSTFDFFTVTIPSPFLAPFGTFGGTLLVQGGGDQNAFNNLNLPENASFDVNVAAASVPEPSSFALFATVLAGLVILHRRRRSG